jgi:deoxycytidylate deaminase
MRERLLAGGCFDILHDSHREWLRLVASKASHIKFLLQSDEVIEKKKGPGRPLFPYEWRELDIRQFLDSLNVPYEVHKRETHHTLKDFITEGERFIAPREEYFYIANHIHIPEVGGHHSSDIYNALIKAQRSSVCKARQVGAVLISPNGDLISSAYNGPKELHSGWPCQKYIEYEKHYGPDRSNWGGVKDLFVECSYPHAEECLLGALPIKGCYLITTCAPCIKCAKAIIGTGIARVSCLAPHKRMEGLNHLIENNVMVYCKGL